MAMSKSAAAYLVTESFTKDSFGIYGKTMQKRKVYVDVSSVNANEWFEGGRNGLNPEYRFRMFSHDYQGEQIIEYNSVQYTIYRTYLRKKDEIELYCEKKKGNEQWQEEAEGSES